MQAWIASKFVAFAGVAAAVLALDQLGKRHAASVVEVGEHVPILGSWLAWTHVPTAGGALGLLRDWSPRAELMAYAGIAAVATVVVAVFLRSLAPRDLGTGAALGAVFAGIASNTFDRYRFGSTLEFLHVGPPASSLLPDFNLADLAILLGVGTLIIELLATEMAARAGERPRRSPPY
ncbi:MAG: signal peptidase II [Myxococcota bacterium]